MKTTLVMLIFIVVGGVDAQEPPTSIVCSGNAKTFRDYADIHDRWEGFAGASDPSFGVVTKQQPDPVYLLRDKIFSNLNTTAPTVRSITRANDQSPERSEEFASRVLLRTESEVFLYWTNGINKVWTATIDLRIKKAVITQVFRGVSSVGGELETLDCR